MKRTFDLSALDWELAGCVPHLWELEKTISGWQATTFDVPPIKAKVPGSVQAALRDAGVLPDWNIGDNARLCEWVENRHWIYKAALPDEWMMADGLDWTLDCQGLDYCGWLYVNNRRVGEFVGTHIPHSFCLDGFLAPHGNVLELIFGLAPRWLGAFGFSSRIREWKTRFNYTWDWAPRLVQIGIWDRMELVATDGNSMEGFRCAADVDMEDRGGVLWMQGGVRGKRAAKVDCELSRGGSVIASVSFDAALFGKGVAWDSLPVELWWPNGMGGQPLYELTCTLTAADGTELDSASRRVGFRNVQWLPCVDAPGEADPWLCAVNGSPVFLQGFNFQPIRCNYADLTIEDYTRRLDIYKDIGTNLFRINACGYLEFECFYDLCDEYGIMVWQEFPLTSSGLDNWPPEEESAIEAMAGIAQSFICRRQHHASLIAWGGSNEQMGDMDGGKTGMGKPCTQEHPMLARLGEVVESEDPTRRYIPTSPLGPVAGAEARNFGRGMHWDVHGPNINFPTDEEMRQYWASDDALFRAEIYVSGAADADAVRKYKGEWAEMPASKDNPMWCRPTPWWNDWEELVRIHGREPATLEEYAGWSQAKQAERLTLGMKACKDRFPRMGGSLMWGSHDTTPMPVNTTVIDFDGNPKPSAFALKRLWTGRA
jgi:beta-mannosidase